jgi:hypothetical protein
VKRTTTIDKNATAPTGRPHPLLTADAVAQTRERADQLDPATIHDQLVIEAADLDTGIPAMYRDYGHKIRMAYDPAQTSEAQAKVLVILQVSRARREAAAQHPHEDVLLAGQAREHVEPVQAAEGAIRTALRARLAGLTTNPRDLADQLHTAIEGAQAEHLARPEVGGFALDEARGHEAFGTAVSAMARALEFSANPKSTAEGLRSALAMVIREAGA